MALFQINDPNARGTGHQFGQDLGNSLEMLLGHKMQHLQRQAQENRNYNAFRAQGLGEEQARAYAPLDNDFLKQIFSDELSRYGARGPQREEATVDTLLGQPDVGQIRQQSPQTDLLKQLLQSQEAEPQGPMTQQQALSQALQGSSLNGEKGLVDYLQAQQLLQPSQHQAQQPNPGAQPTGMGMQAKEPKPAIATLPNLVGLKPQEKAQMLRSAHQQDLLARKEALAERRFAQIEQHASDKETKPVYDEIHKEAKAAKNNDKRLEKMEQLIKTGKLTNPIFASAIKAIGKGIFGFGIDLSALQNPESQQFDKLSNDFLREAKSIFGSRLTDADLNAFLKTVPTLSISNEGKMHVIQNMRQFNETAKIKEKALNDIIKENGGRRPRGLLELVDERIGPQLDVIAKRFKQSVGPVESTQSLPTSIAHAIPNLFFG